MSFFKRSSLLPWRNVQYKSTSSLKDFCMKSLVTDVLEKFTDSYKKYEEHCVAMKSCKKKKKKKGKQGNLFLKRIMSTHLFF